MQTITANNLHKRFGREEVLGGIDLAVKRGEVLGILGPSGAGKNDAGQVLIGILKPDAGEVRILGTPMPSLAMMDGSGTWRSRTRFTMDLSGIQNLVFYGG